MSLEKPRSKKSVKSEAIPIELDPKLSSQERLDKLRRHAEDLTHYPISHIPTLSEHEQGITRGPTIPAELTPEFVDSLTPEEQQHFLENIIESEYKKGSLEKSKQQLALEYYAANDSEEGVERGDHISIITVAKAQNRAYIASQSVGKNSITQFGHEILKRYRAEQKLTYLFTHAPVIHGIDMSTSSGYINIIRVLNTILQHSKITFTQILNLYQINASPLRYILSVLSKPENQLIESNGKGIAGNPKLHNITKRGEVFLADSLKILLDMGENTQLKSRANETDVDQNNIEAPPNFRFPSKIVRTREILNYIAKYGLEKGALGSDLSIDIDLNYSLVQPFLKFAHEQQYLARKAILDGKIRSYLYSITERGLEFLHELQNYYEIKEMLINNWRKENDPVIFIQAIQIIQILYSQRSPLSKEQITVSMSANKVSGYLFPFLENLNPAIIISTPDPSSNNTHPRKFYSLTDYAQEQIIPIIDQYQKIESKLIHEHMLTWKKPDGSPVKFY